MRTSTMAGAARGLLRMVALVLVCSAGAACSSGDEGGSSSGSHWLACRVNDDCAGHGAGARCGSEGHCVDGAGEPIPAPLASGAGASATGSGGNDGAGSGAAAGSGSAGTTAAGGNGSAGTTVTSGRGGSGASAVDGGTWDPCAGKACGDVCTLCAPSDLGCMETLEVKACDAEGTCSGGPVECESGALTGCAGAEPGSTCGYAGDEPPPECCYGDIHLRCVPVGCSSAAPGRCQGVFEGLRTSRACGATLVNAAECPATPPSMAVACDAPDTVCTFAEACCVCSVFASCGPDPVWGCAPKNPGCPDAPPAVGAACSASQEGLDCFSCEGTITSFTCQSGAWAYGTSSFGCL